MLKKAVKPRKLSTVVSSPVRKKKTVLLNKIPMALSGGSQEAEVKQHGINCWEEAGYQKNNISVK